MIDKKEILDKVEEMEYNPLVKGRIVSIYPKLAKVVKLEEVKSMEYADADKLVRFVVLLVDPMSPFAEDKNIEDRMMQCFSLLKIPKNTKVYAEIMEMGEVFRDFMFNYFRLIHAIDYEAWITLKLNFHNSSRYLRVPISPEVSEKEINARRQLSKEIGNMRKELVDLEYKLFQDKRLLKLINDAQMDEAIGGYVELNAQELDDFLGHG